MEQDRKGGRKGGRERGRERSRDTWETHIVVEDREPEPVHEVLAGEELLALSPIIYESENASKNKKRKERKG